MRIAIACLVLCGGCSLSTVNRVALVASTAALACDWGQTRGMAEAGWGGGVFREDNPIMGNHPDVATVDGYFATVATLNMFAWLAIPRRYRWIIPSAVFVAQAVAVAGNARIIEDSPGTAGRMNGYACGM